MINVRKLPIKLASFHAIIEASITDAEVATALQKVGVNKKHLAVGTTLLQEVQDLINAQTLGFQAGTTARNNFKDAFKAAEATYTEIYKIATLLSADNSNLQSQLDLKSLKRINKAVWIQEASNFYARLLAETEFAASLAQYKITTKKIDIASAQVKQLITLNNEVNISKGQSQEATRVKNSKFRNLEAYCIKLKGMAEIALKDNPQLLEKLGVIV